MARRPLSAGERAWLAGEIEIWRHGGILSEPQTAQIWDLYERLADAARRRHSKALTALMGVASVLIGMAGLAIELAAAQASDVEIEIVPGVTAALAAGAALGAPLMLDFAVVSLSDLLVPWGTIRRRLAALAGADIVVALYNPRSTKRVTQLQEAVALFAAARGGRTPVGVVTAAGTDEQTKALTDLDGVLAQEIGMRSIVIIGNSMTRIVAGSMVSARGYEV